MRRILSLVLSIIMMFSLCACGNKETAKINCSSCGESISKDVAFCEYCGTAVNNEKTESENTSSDNYSAQNRQNLTDNKEFKENKDNVISETIINQPKNNSCKHKKIMIVPNDKSEVPTCTNSGYYLKWCPDCYLEIEVFSEALGHKYETETNNSRKICSQCGYVDGEIIHKCSCGFFCTECSVNDGTCAHYTDHYKTHKDACPHYYNNDPEDDWCIRYRVLLDDYKYHQKICDMCDTVWQKQKHNMVIDTSKDNSGSTIDYICEQKCGYSEQNLASPSNPSTPSSPSTPSNPSTPTFTDVLMLSNTQTISNQTINTDVYIASAGRVTFNNVTVNGNIYCYGQLTTTGICSANGLYAYKYGSMLSCGAFDGTHGKVTNSGKLSCDSVVIKDDALIYAFNKWGKK